MRAGAVSPALAQWVRLPASRQHTGCALHSRKIYQCHKCHHQTSLTAGTIFHGNKLTLCQWFLAISLLTQRQQSLSAMQLSRDLGVKYDTAWRLKHKLMPVMFERKSRSTLSARVEIDDAYLGGEMPGKRGRGADHKVPDTSPSLSTDSIAAYSSLPWSSGWPMSRSEHRPCLSDSSAWLSHGGNQEPF